MPECNVNISVDIASILTEQFFKKMGKPFKLDTRTFITAEQFQEQQLLFAEKLGIMEAEKLITISAEAVSPRKPDMKDEQEEQEEEVMKLEKEKTFLQGLAVIRRNRDALEPEIVEAEKVVKKEE